MLSTMMSFPLTLHHVLEKAGHEYREIEIVSRKPDRSLHRYTYGHLYERARRLAEVLQGLGLQPGDRVATLMWNHYAHLEAYFGVPVAGGVLHTLNMRLFSDDIAYIINQAEDRFLIVDDVLLPLYEKFRDAVRLDNVIVVPFGDSTVPDDYLDYERLLANASGDLDYPPIDEKDAAGMCYTSGTTGRPKGVVYSHRSTLLHALAIALPDSLNLGTRETVVPVVPMFHVNAWGIPYAATLTGAKQVFPGPHLDGESLLDLFAGEQATSSAGVPTIWLGILNALERQPQRWKLTPGMVMISGGSATPAAMIKAFDRFGVQVVSAWGMTETSPVGTVARLKGYMSSWKEGRTVDYRAKAGLPVPLVEVRVQNENGNAAWDGETAGELQARGPWVASSYYAQENNGQKFTPDGWLCTGDVANISPDGFVQITDRTKDLIKSGGEWISSVALENELMAHPAVQEAVVIAVPHPSWMERPLAVIVLKQDQNATDGELKKHLQGKFADWWLPDGYAFVDSIPRTSTGKFLKAKVREQFKDWMWD